MLVEIVLLILGFFMLIYGADLLVKGASDIAIKLNISDIIVGLTIVSIGTSLPELFISISSAISNFSNLTLGNVIGSNICNLLLILGLASIIKPINMNIKETENYITFSLFSTVLLFAMGNIDGYISSIEGIILSLCFILFLTYTIITSLKNRSNKISSEPSNNSSMPNHILISIFFIIIGIIMLKYGGDFVSDNAVLLAQALNVSENIIGLTIVAIGTSLPELITSIVAGIQGKSEIAVGNIIGSNILNICLILGSAALINPITFSTQFNSALILLMITTIMLWVFKDIGQKDTVTRIKGTTFLITYLINTFCLYR